MVRAFGTQTKHQQADLLIVCNFGDTKSNPQVEIAASRVSSVGLNIQHTLHVKLSHTLQDDKTDATLFLVSSTPNKVPHFLQEIGRKSFPYTWHKPERLYVWHAQTNAIVDFSFVYLVYK